MSGTRNLKKGEILFREGDESDAMYVIKSGKIAITRPKGSGEIVLAELGAGDMLGEMAFFDAKPRSAGARAMIDSIVIVLPFKALNAQFKALPEWLKAVIRTVNNHLRNANAKIKMLEKTSEDDAQFFTPHLVTRLSGILGLIATRFGEKTPEGVVVPAGTLRRYTIQIFQQPTNKMQRFMDVLQSYQHMKIEDLGEGRQKITVFNPDFLIKFTDFYNDWIFKDESKRTTISEKELKPLKALIHYGKKQTPDAKGMAKVNLTAMQTEALRDLGTPFSADDVNTLAEKKVTSEKMSVEGAVMLSFNLQELEDLYPHWELIHACGKIQRD